MRAAATTVMWFQSLIFVVMVRSSIANRAIITLLDNTLWSYRAETAEFGYRIDDKFVYHATMMTPPGDDSQLCSFPSFMLDEKDGKAEQLKTPVALLVSLGGCDAAQKVEVALEIHRKVTEALRFLVFYNNDPDNPDDIMPLTAPRDTGFSDDMDQMSFSSVSTATGSAMLERIQRLSVVTGRSPDLFSDMNEGWNLQMFLETLIDPQNNGTSNYRAATTNFYWFRIVLFTLLITSPCCRAAYLWWAGGGRIRFRRNENGRFIGFQYTPPMSYWFVANGVQENAPIVTDRLTEEEVMALPEIVYKTPPPDENDVPENDILNKEMSASEPLEDIDIAVSSGSADPEQEVESVSEESPVDEEQPAGPAAPSENLTTTCTCCSICIDEFEAGECIRLLPRCRHAFHTDCILPWLTGRQGCCPLCKSSVLEPEEGSTSIDEESNTIEDNFVGSNSLDTSGSRGTSATAATNIDEEDEESQIVEDQGDVEITGVSSGIEIRLAEEPKPSHFESRAPESAVGQEDTNEEESASDNVRELLYLETPEHADDKQHVSNSTTAANESSSSLISGSAEDDLAQGQVLGKGNETAIVPSPSEVSEKNEGFVAAVVAAAGPEPVEEDGQTEEAGPLNNAGETEVSGLPSASEQDEAVCDAARSTEEATMTLPLDGLNLAAQKHGDTGTAAQGEVAIDVAASMDNNGTVPHDESRLIKDDAGAEASSVVSNTSGFPPRRE